MPASIIIQLDDPSRHFLPGEEIAGTFRFVDVRPGELRRLEFSVLWFTEGKGDEDIGVHHFESISWDEEEEERREFPVSSFQFPEAGMSLLETENRKLETFSFRVPLPASPLSYYGLILKIRWCVRVRIFLKNGREMMNQKLFLLGTLPPVEISLG